MAEKSIAVFPKRRPIVRNASGIEFARQTTVRDDFAYDSVYLLARRLLEPFAVHALHGELLEVHALQQLALYLRLHAAPELAHGVLLRAVVAAAVLLRAGLPGAGPDGAALYGCRGVCAVGDAQQA